MFSKLFSSKNSSKVLFWVSLGSAGFGMTFFFLCLKFSRSSSLHSPSYPTLKIESSPQVEKEGLLQPTPSFFLKEQLSLDLPKFENEIEFYHFESRPDSEEFSPYIVKLKKTHAKKPISYGERIYLTLGSSQNLSFSSVPGPFWLELEAGCRPWCMIQVESSDEVKIPSTYYRFPSVFQKVCSGYSIREHMAFLKLGQAKLWGADQLLEDSDPYRIEIQGAGGAYLCGAKEKSILFFDEGVWKTLADNDLSRTKGKPLAQIQKILERSLEIEGWDETGEKYYTFSLVPISMPPVSIKSEEWMSSIRMKTQKKISCLLERQKMVLKIGDWAVKNLGKWKVLKDKSEIQDCYDRCDLELFIFDGIENKNGIKFLYGRLFHSMRTHCTSIEVPIQSSRHSQFKRHSPVTHLRGGK